MTEQDIAALAKGMMPVVREIVQQATSEVIRRVEALEARPAPEKGEAGADGRGIEGAGVNGGVLVLRLTDGTELEAGEVAGAPGNDGVDGKDADPEAIAETFRPIAEGIVSEAVAAGIASLPPPEKGDKGDQGDPGNDGSDGCGIADLLVDRDGSLVATFDDGRMKNLGKIVGKDGENGQPGRDGFSLDDFDIEAGEDGRTVTLKFQQGEMLHSYELVFPVTIYRDVFKAGETYQPGDAVTWGGSLWVAQRETGAKPDSPDSGFRLAVKKGRDGKDAKAA